MAIPHGCEVGLPGTTLRHLWCFKCFLFADCHPRWGIDRQHDFVIENIDHGYGDFVVDDNALILGLDKDLHSYVLFR